LIEVKKFKQGKMLLTIEQQTELEDLMEKVAQFGEKHGASFYIKMSVGLEGKTQSADVLILPKGKGQFVNDVFLHDLLSQMIRSKDRPPEIEVFLNFMCNVMADMEEEEEDSETKH